MKQRGTISPEDVYVVYQTLESESIGLFQKLVSPIVVCLYCTNVLEVGITRSPWYLSQYTVKLLQF